MEPLVCIILVNYNGHKDTVDCVKSLLKTHYSNYKIIVVDNASTQIEKIADDSFLQKYTDVIVSKNNLGFSGGNNIAIGYAEKKYGPDYYLLLNNDTIVDPNFLRPLVNAAIERNNNVIVGGKIYYFSKPKMLWYAGGEYNRNNGFASHYGYKNQDGDNFNEDKEILFVTGCLMLIPKQVDEKIGRLDDSFFLYSEDIDYCCRAQDTGVKLLYCHKSVIYHKVSASTVEGSPFQQYCMLRNDLFIIKKYGEKKAICYLKRANDIRKMLCRKEIKFVSVKRAVWDFLLNKKGKQQYNW